MNKNKPNTANIINISSDRETKKAIHLLSMDAVVLYSDKQINIGPNDRANIIFKILVIYIAAA